MPHDVMIALGPKDEDMIDSCIRSIRTCIQGARTIFVVAHRPMDISGAVVVEESAFPFSVADVAKHVPAGRAGWYLQQLLKLYAPLVLKDALANILLVDADTVFYRKVKFMDGPHWLYDFNRETHAPYFEHMARLYLQPWRPRVSGIVNAMILNRGVVEALFKHVEAATGTPFWLAFLSAVSPGAAAGASEYELYFHYVMRNYPKLTRVRHLQYNNFAFRADKDGGGGGYDYVSYHWHHQKKRA